MNLFIRMIKSSPYVGLGYAIFEGQDITFVATITASEGPNKILVKVVEPLARIEILCHGNVPIDVTAVSRPLGYDAITPVLEKFEKKLSLLSEAAKVEFRHLANKQLDLWELESLRSWLDDWTEKPTFDALESLYRHHRSRTLNFRDRKPHPELLRVIETTLTLAKNRDVSGAYSSLDSFIVSLVASLP